MIQSLNHFDNVHKFLFTINKRLEFERLSFKLGFSKFYYIKRQIVAVWLQI